MRDILLNALLVACLIPGPALVIDQIFRSHNDQGEDL